MKKFFVFILVCSLAVPLFAVDAPRTARLVRFEGDVQVKLSQTQDWQTPTEGAVFTQGAVIKTGVGAYAVLSVEDGSKTATIDMEQKSQLLLAELLTDPKEKVQKTLLDLSVGSILVRAQKLRDPESKFEVKTPTSVVGIRGTVFSVHVEAAEPKQD